MSKADKAAAAALALFIGAGAQGADEEQQARLVEQKLKLVEMLVNSPAAKASSADPAAAAALDKRRQLLDEARQAAVERRWQQAGRALDEALVRAAQGKAATAGAELAEGASRTSLKNLGEQLASYRASLDTLVRSGRPGAAELLARSDALAAEAKAMAIAGRFDDANRRLGEAYRLVVEGLAKLQAGQTVTLSLKFESPADEYAYEERRFASNELLVAMMIDEGRAEGERRRLVESFGTEARQLRQQAQTLASRGDHKAAVSAMEKASAQLNRALQAMGVPVF